MVTRNSTRTLKNQSAPKQATSAGRPRKPRLPDRVRDSLADFQRRVLELFPNDVSQIVLYGSYARGDWREESDVDVMVVVEGWEAEGAYLGGPGDARWRKIVDAAVDTLIQRGGPYISTLVIGEKLFNSNLSVACEAKDGGIVLWKSP